MPNSKDPSKQKLAAGLRINQSPAEQILWSHLRNHQLLDVHFRRQYPIDPYIVDFCAPALHLVIEVDGSHHANQSDYDSKRTKYLVEKGYHVLRFWTADIFTKVDSVLRVIYDHVENHLEKK